MVNRTSPPAKKVLLIEPHAVCRLAVGRLIWSVGPELILVGDSAGLEQGLRLARGTAPDIIVVGSNSPDARDVRAILSAVPAARVVVLSPTEDGGVAFAVMRAGAWAFVPKSAAPEDVLGTLRLVAGGEKIIHPSVTAAALIWIAEQEASGTEARARWATLTHRERDVLQLLASGLRPRQIAEDLYLSRRTVEWYLSSSYRKLGVHGQIDALRKVHRLPMSAIGS
jgi:DNA-binding NarL/FixJ family response regulator